MIAQAFGAPLRRLDRGAVVVLGSGILGAAAGGYLLLHRSAVMALAFCALPLVVWLMGQLTLALVLLGVSTPFIGSLTGGGAFNLALSDVFLVLLGGALFFQAALTGRLPGFASLRVVRAPVLQYSMFMVVLLVVHLGTSDFFKTGQRFELFLLPLVVGAFAVSTGRHVALLKGYVVAASVLAAAWPLAESTFGQKNPVAQMIANALLLLVAVRDLRSHARLAIVLVPGLLLTGSRGAVLATAIGLVVILIFQSSRMRGIVPRVLLVLVAGLAVYALLPATLQSRYTTLTAGETSTSAYAIKIRQQLSADAKSVIRKHPVIGVGVGNYRSPTSPPGSPPQDPHNVLLLQAAEGGYGLAASFVLLVAGVTLVLYRMRKVELVPAAAAVLLATIAHGMVDVYWVRATPVLGWILVGMACATAARPARSVGEEH